MIRPDPILAAADDRHATPPDLLSLTERAQRAHDAWVEQVEGAARTSLAKRLAAQQSTIADPAAAASVPGASRLPALWSPASDLPPSPLLVWWWEPRLAAPFFVVVTSASAQRKSSLRDSTTGWWLPVEIPEPPSPFRGGK